MMHVYQQPPRLGELLPGAELIPESVESLDQIIQRLLQKRPAERFSSMRAVADSLEKEVDLLLVQRGEKAVLSTTLQERLRRGAGSSPSVKLLDKSTAPEPGHVEPSLPPRRFPALRRLLPLVGLLTLSGGALLYLGETRQCTPSPQVPLRSEASELRRAALDALDDSLQQGDADERVRVLRALGQTGDVELYGKIAVWLSNADARVQAAAVEALAELGLRTAVPALLRLVENSQSAALMATAAAALRRLGERRGRVVLEDLLDGLDPEGRIRAALALAEERSPRALSVLRAAVADPPKELTDELLGAALRVLAQDGDAQALLRLRAALAPSSPRPGPRLAPLTAAALLQTLGDPEGESFLRARSRETPGSPGLARTEQVRAASLLASPERPALGALFREVLDDKDERRSDTAARTAALRGLGALGQPGDGLRLAAMLRPQPGPSSDPLLRREAATALLQLLRLWPETLIARSLAWSRAVLGDGDAALREAAAAVLADSATGPSVPLLTTLLHDTEGSVRQAAARALGRHESAAALKALREAVSDGELGVRIEVLRAMGRLVETRLRQGERIVPGDVQAWCRESLTRGSPAEQLIVRSTLVRLGDSAQILDLLRFRSSADPQVRRLLIELIPSRPDVLVEALRDDDPQVRLLAARRLALRGDGRARAVLSAVLQQGGPDALAAYGLLRKLGDTTPAPPSLDAPLLRGEPPVRGAAVDALVYLPDELAVPLLGQAARDPEPSVRLRVAEVAASLRPAEAGASRTASPGAPVLRRLITDPDAAVRARAQAALARTL